MKKIPFTVLAFLIVFGCKKPFTPVLVSSQNTRYLVIEGVIDGADSTFIRLSRTKKVDTLKTIIPETGAIVTIESDASEVIPLIELKPGTYTAPPFNLNTSHKYRLRIKTTAAKEYLSDFVQVKNSPPIDSVGFNAQPSGVTMYVNSHDASNSTRYYRWEYNEAWQFHTQYVSAWIRPSPEHISGERLPSEQVYTCFTGDTSSNIIIGNTTKLGNDIVYQSPVTTVRGNSEKIEMKYSILVKQYALTSDAYAFWQNLQDNTENLGGIFSVLPSQSPTNFHCVTNPAETVVGYLSAGGVAYKRIFITSDQLLPSYQPLYPTVCKLDTVFLNPKTPEEVIETNEYNHNYAAYTLVTGLYLPPPNPFGGPTAWTYSTVLCADCTIRGKREPPPFWQ
jgi:hypothetical protein